MRIFVGHECTNSPTRSEANRQLMFLGLWSPAECLVKVPTVGRVMCILVQEIAYLPGVTRH